MGFLGTGSSVAVNSLVTFCFLFVLFPQGTKGGNFVMISKYSFHNGEDNTLWKLSRTCRCYTDCCQPKLNITFSHGTWIPKSAAQRSERVKGGGKHSDISNKNWCHLLRPNESIGSLLGHWENGIFLPLTVVVLLPRKQSSAFTYLLARRLKLNPAAAPPAVHPLVFFLRGQSAAISLSW